MTRPDAIRCLCRIDPATMCPIHPTPDPETPTDRAVRLALMLGAAKRRIAALERANAALIEELARVRADSGQTPPGHRQD